jgi:hypothetical protein
MSDKPISDLRRRMIADMTVRTFGDKTQRDYIRHIEALSDFSAARPTPRPATTSATSSSRRSSRAHSHRR